VFVAAKFPSHPLSQLLGGAAIRTGVYVGLSISFVFTAWLVVANRVPFLQPFATPRNLIAASLLACFGCTPLLRFLRSPAEMLLSSMLAWGIFTLTYGLLCLKFVLLDQYYSTFQVFVLGAVIYLLFATLSWIGTIIWRVRATHSSHPRH
jgi:di/tricarboxylate transporter